MSMRSPLDRRLTASVPAQATPGTGQTTIVGEYQDSAGLTGTVTEASLLPASAVAANGSNFRTFTLFNRGATGVGTVVVATYDTSTTGLVDNDEKLMTLSGTPANLVVNTDDVFELVETVTGTGVAHTGLKVDLTITRN